MGIGLAYCNKMLTKMNSKLECISVLNIGSTFSFKIKVKYEKDHIEMKNANANQSTCEAFFDHKKRHKLLGNNAIEKNDSFKAKHKKLKHMMKQGEMSSFRNKQKEINIKVDINQPVAMNNVMAM